MVLKTKQPIIAIALVTAICLAGDSMLYIVLPTHWKEVGLTSLVQVGILLSVNRFVRLPLNPLIGFIYKKVNLRNGILLAVILSGITTISYGFVADFSIWIILRSVWGLSWSLFKLGAFLLILQLSKDTNRGNFMGTYNGLYRLGSLFGMLLGGLFADLFGIKVISMVLGIFAFMSIPIIFKYIPKVLQSDNSIGIKPSLITKIGLILNRRLILILITAFLLTMILDGMLTATLSHVIEVKFTNKIDILGIIVGAATLAGMLQALRWGLAPFIVPKVGNMLDKAVHKNKMLAIFLASAFILLAIIPSNIPLLLWLPILLVHVLIASILTMVMDTLAGDYASKVTNKILIMTIFTIIVDLGAALGPIAGYTLEQKFGLTNLFWLGAGICLFLSITWIIPSNERAKQTIFQNM
ncbi:MFS transporter [Bacillus sp. CGMCC 1.16607]|uniref:MFS transporter n=1 Tax=Bacillus sp. CGMCC 1.16607 TaxID=3351842 RepID=UPI00363ACAD7